MYRNSLTPAKVPCATNTCINHTVYIGIAMVSSLKTIYKDFVYFHFQFEVDFTFNDIKMKNM